MTLRQANANRKGGADNPAMATYVKKPAAPRKPPKYRRTYLRAYREWKGWSVEKLAYEMDYNSGSLNEIENGNKRYNQDVIERAAVALGVPPAFILGKAPPPKGEEIDYSDPAVISWIAYAMEEEDRRPLGKMISPFAPKRSDENP